MTQTLNAGARTPEPPEADYWLGVRDEFRNWLFRAA
jgi:hypothetical protein